MKLWWHGNSSACRPSITVTQPHSLICVWSVAGLTGERQKKATGTPGPQLPTSTLWLLTENIRQPRSPEDSPLVTSEHARLVDFQPEIFLSGNLKGDAPRMWTLLGDNPPVTLQWRAKKTPQPSSAVCPSHSEERPAETRSSQAGSDKRLSGQSYSFPSSPDELESQTIEKAEHPKIDAFELGGWRRLLRVPWTTRRFNQSVLKEISPEYSSEGLMLKLKLQSFGHLIEELTHWEKPWCWERLKAGGEGDDRGWDGWMASPTGWTGVWVSSGRWWRTGKPDVLRSMGS